MKQNYPQFYSEEGAAKFTALNTSPSRLVKQMCSQTNLPGNLLFLKKAYHLYEKFSKLEHLGDLSFHLTHLGYDNSLIYESVEDLHISIILITEALINYSVFWNIFEEKSIISLRNLQKKINTLTPFSIGEYTENSK